MGREVVLVPCAPSSQTVMQEFCVQQCSGCKMSRRGPRPDHDRCATIRGVHAELPEHGI
jgi:hypothetical protein